MSDVKFSLFFIASGQAEEGTSWPWLNHIKQGDDASTPYQSPRITSMMKVLFALNLLLLPLLAMGQEVDFGTQFYIYFTSSHP